MRTVMLAAIAAIGLAQQSDSTAETPMIDCGGECACVDISQSNGWADSGTGQDRLSIRVKVPDWRSGKRVTATWPGFIIIDDAYGFVDLVEGADSEGHVATVELHGRQTGPDAAFVLMGHGTAGMPTSFSCSSAATTTAASTATASLASTSAVVDCDLGAHWALPNPYPRLADGKISFDTWEAGRVVTVTFAQQEFNPLNPRFATIRETTLEGGNTIVAFELEQIGAERLCHTGSVNEQGVYVRDVNCGTETGTDRLFFSFQLDCPTCTSEPRAPSIICHDASPPPPHGASQRASTGNEDWSDQYDDSAADTYALALPPAVSPPPPPPRVEATSCSSGGLAEVQRHSRGQGEQETLRIVVRPTQWWPTGYIYDVGFRGLGLRVWGQDGADELPHEADSFDVMAVHNFVFRPKRGRQFSFNVDGVDVILVSLTCRQPSSPPSPPLLSPPPPPPAPPTGIVFTFGLRSVSSRLAIAVLAALIFGRLAVRYWPARSCRALHRSFFGDAARSVISAAEMDGGGADDNEPSAKVWQDHGRWSVLFEVSGREAEAPLPQSVAASVPELRAALAELASEILGPKATPMAWVKDDLHTMRVQYVDAQERPLTMRDSTLFRELRASPYLRVTEER